VKGANNVPSVLNDAILSLDQDGKGFLFYFNLKPLISLVATPKRRRGRKAQQARTVASAATAADTATTTVDTAATTATTTTTMATMAATTPTATTPAAATPAATPAATTPATTPAITTFVTPTRGTITMQAATAITITGFNPIDDDDPFLVPSSIHPYERSPANQPDANIISEGSTVHQKNSKDAAEDVKTFFRHENERWYCKFCKYVFHSSTIPAFLIYSSQSQSVHII